MAIPRPSAASRRVLDLAAVGLAVALAACTTAGHEPASSPVAAAPATSLPATSRPAPDLTILAMGDSTVWDHDCVDCTHSYPHQLRDVLAAATGKQISLIDATQHNSLTAPQLLQELEDDSWGDFTQDRHAPSPRESVAKADIVTITLGANDVPWQQDEDPVCRGQWDAKSCFERKAAPSLTALGKVIDLVHAIRGARPTAIRVTTFYNELIPSSTYVPDRPPEAIAKALTGARVFSDALNSGICSTAKSHGALCVDIYHAVNGPNGRKPLPANWFVWPGHPRGYDQTFTTNALVKAGFAPLHL